MIDEKSYLMVIMTTSDPATINIIIVTLSCSVHSCGAYCRVSQPLGFVYSLYFERNNIHLLSLHRHIQDSVISMIVIETD